MTSYLNLTAREISEILQKCCDDGDLETLKSLFSSEHARSVLAHPDTILNFVAEKGHLHLVKYLLTSPDLEENADIMVRNDNPFRAACKNGHLELVKYILHTPLGRTTDLKTSIRDGITYAADSGQLDILRYFLTSPDININDKPSIDNGQNKALKQAVINDQLNIVQYVLTSPELIKYADIHTDNDVCFENALQLKHLDILKYFIFDLNIKKTHYIEESLSRYPNKKVIQYFEMRDLNSNLSDNLISNASSLKKPKI
jgi:hypothetical protein